MNRKRNYEDSPHLEDNRPRPIDVHSKRSNKSGLLGLLETLIRKFKGASFALALAPLFLIYLTSFSLALTPGVFITLGIWELVATSSIIIKSLTLSISLALSYMLYGISLVFIVPFFNWLFQFNRFIKSSWRGNWYSLEALPWYYHNALTQLVRYTFLDFITPTPLNILFFKLMGMKIGKGVMINTSNISDPCLIELEDYVTIGGSATIFGHYAQGGILILAPVLIKRGATIGLKASIMGDVIIGEKVTIRPHTVILPKARIEKEKKPH